LEQILNADHSVAIRKVMQCVSDCIKFLQLENSQNSPSNSTSVGKQMLLLNK